jgi:hypothetical protein
MMFTLTAAAMVAQEPVHTEKRPEAEGAELHLSSNASTYQQGELIQLKLSFTSKIPNRYELNLARYDRSGRMGYEKFLVEPADGSVDPLLGYFKSVRTFFSGGLTNFESLSEKPTVIPLDLNEWVRFDKPGKYLVTVLSSRAGDTNVGTYKHGTRTEIRSNTIELEILAPDPAWQQAELQRILFELSKPPPAYLALTAEARYSALRRLRYLGSAEATRELARHLRGDELGAEGNFMFGLVGSPNRSIGLEEMRMLLVDPDFPVGNNFLTAMSILPLDPTETSESLLKQRDANFKAERSALIAALANKKGTALDESLKTVMQGIGSDEAFELKNQFVARLIESFDQLTVKQQLDWLERDWPKVNDPRWLPVVRSIAAQYTDFAPPHNRMDAYQSLKLTGTALMRWYELDPSGARAAVIAEIVRAKPRYSANTLGLLPDETLPTEQRAIALHFVSAPDYETEGNLASLLARYADAAVLPTVLGKIQQKVALGHWECVPQSNSLKYVQKVDPEAAKPLLAQFENSPCRKISTPSNSP